MKNILPWIKSNTAIVILSALILLILPAAFVGSSMWNSRIKKGREKAVSEKNSALDALKVTYSLPPAVPGGKSIEFPWPAPNKLATDFFREHRTKIEDAIKRITHEAEAINKQGHAALLDGVFPSPTTPVRTLEFAELLVGKGDKVSVYQQLLDSIKAGPPADPVKVAEVLREANTQAIEKQQAANNTVKLSDEEQKAHNELLTKIRIGQYKAHSQTIAVYATRDCLPVTVPRTIPPEPPAVTECWKWQEDYWVVYDILTGIAEANKVNGKLGRVEDSVVKRIEQIVLHPLESSSDTVTGRMNSAANKSYDVRNATVRLMVSSSRLPQLINALSRTDFTTVTGLDLTEVDRSAELAKGMYFGEEHVVNATLTLETVWLRSWTSTIMPEEEKKRREATAEEVAAANQPAAAPAATPRGRGASADEEAPARGAKKKEKSTKRPKKGGE